MHKADYDIDLTNSYNLHTQNGRGLIRTAPVARCAVSGQGFLTESRSQLCRESKCKIKIPTEHKLCLVIQVMPLQCRAYGLHQNHLLCYDIVREGHAATEAEKVLQQWAVLLKLPGLKFVLSEKGNWLIPVEEKENRTFFVPECYLGMLSRLSYLGGEIGLRGNYFFYQLKANTT